jgi:hypothetical protein
MRGSLSCFAAFLLLQFITMPNYISHMLTRHDRRTVERLEKANISFGLASSLTVLHDLTRFLNQTETQRGEKIVRIVELMLELESLTEQIDGMLWVTDSLEKTDPKKYEQLWNIQVKTLFLNRELAKFHSRPRAEVVRGGNGGASQWATGWGRDSRERRESRLRLSPTEAVELVLKLTDIGELTRLRRCSHCTQWLYAKFRHQAFCSMKCQQKHYTQTDEWKARRRAYMRNYYRKNFSGKPR